MLQNCPVMRPAGETFDSHVLGHEHFLDEISNGHRGLASRIALMLPDREPVPDDTLRFFLRQSIRTGCGADINRFTPVVLFESANIRPILVHHDLPRVAVPIKILGICMPLPMQLASNRAEM